MTKCSFWKCEAEATTTTTFSIASDRFPNATDTVPQCSEHAWACAEGTENFARYCALASEASEFVAVPTALPARYAITVNIIPAVPLPRRRSPMNARFAVYNARGLWTGYTFALRSSAEKYVASRAFPHLFSIRIV